MGNFIEEFNQGQKGANKGLYMGPGLDKISRAINGVQKGMMYGVAAAPKCGKSTLVDYGFVINPWLDSLVKNIKLNIIYFSFEMDRITKEFDFACYFLHLDYGHSVVNLPQGVTYQGETSMPISAQYLRGRVQDDDGEIIKICPIILEDLKKVYANRIIPLFGEFSSSGKQIKPGVIEFIEQKENPTGLRNKLLTHASERGTFHYEEFVTKEGIHGKKLVGYTPKDENEYTFVVTDTVRKIPKERGFSLKETIDKFLEYSTEIRNLCKYSFIHIIHLNRNMADVERLKYLKDRLYPTPEDIKDTGNLSEECNHLFTMFNPNDDKYKLTSYFGITIKDAAGNEIFPNLRTIHLVESRVVQCPQHFKVEMEGNVKNFKILT